MLTKHPCQFPYCMDTAILALYKHDKMVSFMLYWDKHRIPYCMHTANFVPYEHDKMVSFMLYWDKQRISVERLCRYFLVQVNLNVQYCSMGNSCQNLRSIPHTIASYFQISRLNLIPLTCEAAKLRWFYNGVRR